MRRFFGSADVVARMAPISARIQVAEMQDLLKPNPDARQGTSDLAGHEGFAAYRQIVAQQVVVVLVNRTRQEAVSALTGFDP